MPMEPFAASRGNSSIFDSFASENEEWIVRLHHWKEEEEHNESEDLSKSLQKTILQTAQLDNLQRASQAYGGSLSIDALCANRMEEMDHDSRRQRSLISNTISVFSSPIDIRGLECSDMEIDAFFDEYPECRKPLVPEEQKAPIHGNEENEDDSQSYPKSPDSRKYRKGNSRANVVDLVTAASKPAHEPRDEDRLQGKNVFSQPLSDHHNRPRGRTKNPYKNLKPTSNDRSCDSSMRRATEPASRSTAGNDASSNTWETLGSIGNNTHRRAENTHRNIDANPYRKSQTRQQQHPSQNRNDSTAAWMNHRNQTNPFQTAREVADAEQNNPHQDPFRNSNPQHLQEQADGGDEGLGGGPFIPDSLKRKFQPPTKRGLKNLPQSRSNHRSLPRPSKPTQTNDDRRPVSSSSQNHGTRQQSTKRSKEADEEDDLPEALQHLDKELVQKIQHEIMESGDSVTFDDIAGLDDAKATVQEVVCWPMKRPDLFTGLRRAPNGLLLYGPPGTGKTLIGKAIAHESGATFFSISSSSLTSKWIGEGEKLVKTLFAVASYHEPAVIFIDEIDSLLTQRKSTENEASRRIKTEFLVQLDGTGTTGRGRVLIIGATNRPQELDEAARRRFTKRLYIPLPAEADRRILLKVLLKTNNHILSDADIDTLAKDTKGFSGADLKSLCTDAAMGPIRQLGAMAMEVSLSDVPPIAYKHFKKSLRGTKPSVAPEDLQQYIEWDQTYGTKRYDEEEDDDDE